MRGLEIRGRREPGPFRLAPTLLANVCGTVRTVANGRVEARSQRLEDPKAKFRHLVLRKPRRNEEAVRTSGRRCARHPQLVLMLQRDQAPAPADVLLLN